MKTARIDYYSIVRRGVLYKWSTATPLYAGSAISFSLVEKATSNSFVEKPCEFACEVLLEERFGQETNEVFPPFLRGRSSLTQSELLKGFNESTVKS